MRAAGVSFGASSTSWAVASMGRLPPAAGAVLQELIDVAAVINALRAALPPQSLTDY